MPFHCDVRVDHVLQARVSGMAGRHVLWEGGSCAGIRRGPPVLAPAQLEINKNRQFLRLLSQEPVDIKGLPAWAKFSS